MVRSTALSPTSTVLVLLIGKRDYMLRFQFSRVSVRLVSDPWPLGGNALFIDPYGQVESPQN